MKGEKNKGYSNKSGEDRRTNMVFYMYNEGRIIVNTNCKIHVFLLAYNVMEHASKYIKNTYINTHSYTHK